MESSLHGVNDCSGGACAMLALMENFNIIIFLSFMSWFFVLLNSY